MGLEPTTYGSSSMDSEPAVDPCFVQRPQRSAAETMRLAAHLNKVMESRPAAEVSTETRQRQSGSPIAVKTTEFSLPARSGRGAAPRVGANQMMSNHRWRRTPEKRCLHEIRRLSVDWACSLPVIGEDSRKDPGTVIVFPPEGNRWPVSFPIEPHRPGPRCIRSLRKLISVTVTGFLTTPGSADIFTATMDAPSS